MQNFIKSALLDTSFVKGIRWAAIASISVAGCATMPGQVSELKVFAVRGIAFGGVPNAVEAAGAKPTTKPAPVPRLGEIYTDLSALNIDIEQRAIFNRKDPEFITFAAPVSTLNSEVIYDGIESPEGATLVYNADVTFTTGDVPLGDLGKASANGSVTRKKSFAKLRTIDIDPGDWPFLDSLASTAALNSGRASIYFVNRIYLADVTDAFTANGKIAVTPTIKSAGSAATTAPSASGDFDESYSGVGLIVGMAFQKVSVNDVVETPKSTVKRDLWNMPVRGTFTPSDFSIDEKVRFAANTKLQGDFNVAFGQSIVNYNPLASADYTSLGNPLHLFRLLEWPLEKCTFR